MSIFVLGIDLGKNSCSVVGLDEADAVVLRRRLRRDGVAEFVRKMPPLVVALAAKAARIAWAVLRNECTFEPAIAAA